MGYGQVIARETTEWAIAKAKGIGAGIVALRNTHHVARVGAYGELAAAAGLVSIHFVNVMIKPGRVAPFGGMAGRFGTDPVCITFPGAAGEPPVVLDFATSRVAAGKLRVALNEGKELPPGHLIDAQGNEATDPAVFFRGNGAMLPFGEHKGSGLALACELLAGVLTGGGAMQDGIPDRGVKNGMFSIVLDPARFGDTGWMAREAAALIGWVKSSPPRPGVEAVLIAGEPERISRAKRLKDGIPVDANTWKELVAAAGQAGAPASAIPQD
jgi:hydroxycarboxylate dehydrogenase B